MSYTKQVVISLGIFSVLVVMTIILGVSHENRKGSEALLQVQKNHDETVQECIREANQAYKKLVYENCLPAGDPQCTTSWFAIEHFETARQADLNICKDIE